MSKKAIACMTDYYLAVVQKSGHIRPTLQKMQIMNKYKAKTEHGDDIEIEADYYNRNGKYIDFYKIEPKDSTNHVKIASIYRPISVIKV